MKLYEFTYTDTEKLFYHGIKDKIQAIVDSEAEIQGWDKNYLMFTTPKQPHQDAEGNDIYTFSVYGNYLET